MEIIYSRNFKGISLMLLVAVFMTIDALIIKVLAGEIHPFFIVFTRAAFGLLACLPWLLHKPQIIKTSGIGLHIMRAIIKLLGLVTLFFALANSSLATVTTITFATPFFVVLGAWIFFSERLYINRVCALIIGFAGIFIVLQPNNSEISLALFSAVLSAIAIASIQLILKYQGQKENADTIVIWNLIVTVPLALLPALWAWSEPTTFQWLLLVIQGVNGALAQFLGARAFQLADASLIAPIDFARLPMVGLLAYLIFQEVPNHSTWYGAAVIFLAFLILTYGNRKKPNHKVIGR